MAFDIPPVPITNHPRWDWIRAKVALHSRDGDDFDVTITLKDGAPARCETFPKRAFDVLEWSYLQLVGETVEINIAVWALEGVGLMQRGSWPAFDRRQVAYNKLVHAKSIGSMTGTHWSRGVGGISSPQSRQLQSAGLQNAADEWLCHAAEDAVAAERERCIAAVRHLPGAEAAIRAASKPKSEAA